VPCEIQDIRQELEPLNLYDNRFIIVDNEHVCSTTWDRLSECFLNYEPEDEEEMLIDRRRDGLTK
jgi:hypothetical protein